LGIQLRGEGRSAILSDLSYDALGCSISTASTSVLTDEVIGRNVQEALTSFTAMRTMLTSKGADPGDEQEIGGMDGDSQLLRRGVQLAATRGSGTLATRVWSLVPLREARPVG